MGGPRGLWGRLFGGGRARRAADKPAAPNGSRYWAFISYSRKDERWAKWLQRKIESFAPPAGGRLYPVFRDDDEAPAAPDLAEALRKALAESHALIVVCSPRANSKWVNEEIAAFRGMPNGDRIIAVIVDGEPLASRRGAPQDECFPEALRSPEPLAADLRLRGRANRRRQFMKVVAALTGHDLGALIGRERRRRRIRMAALAAAAGIAVAAAAGLWVVQQRRLDAESQARLIEEYRAAAAEAREQLRRGRPWNALDGLLAKLPAAGLPQSIRASVPSFESAIRMALLQSRVEAAWPVETEGRHLFRLPPASGLIEHPDGARVLHLGNDTMNPAARLALRDVASGAVVAEARFAASIQFARFIDGGARLVLADSNGHIALLDGATLAETRRDTSFAGRAIRRHLLDARNERLLLAVDGGLALWSYRDFRTQRLPLAVDRPGLALAVSRDGARIALWDPKTRHLEVRTLPGLELAMRIEVERVDALVFTEGGDRIVATASDHMGVPQARITLYDIATGSAIWSDAKHALLFAGSAGNASAALGNLGVDSPRTVLITRSNERFNDHTAQIRALDDGKVAAVVRGHAQRVRMAAIAPGGRLFATAAEDNAIRVFGHGLPDSPLMVLQGHTGWPAFTWSRTDGRLFSVNVPIVDNEIGTAVVWNTRPASSERHIGLAGPALASHGFDGRFIVTGHEDGSVRLWEGASQRLRWVRLAHKGAVGSVAVDGTRRFVLSAASDGLRVFDREGGGPPRAVSLPANDYVLEGLMHPSAPVAALIVATVAGDEITRQRLMMLDLETAALREIPVAGDVRSGTWIAGGRRLVVQTHDPAGRKIREMLLLDPAAGRVVATLFGADRPGAKIAATEPFVTWAGGVLHITSPDTGAVTKTIDFGQDAFDIQVDPRTRLLAAYDSVAKRLTVVDLAAAAPVSDAPQLPGAPSRLRFDGDTLRAGLEDGRICEAPISAAPPRIRAWQCARLVERVEANVSKGIVDLVGLPGTGTVAAVGEAGLFVWHRGNREIVETYEGCNLCSLHALPGGTGFMLQGNLPLRLDFWETGPISGAMLDRARRLTRILRHVDKGAR